MRLIEDVLALDHVHWETVMSVGDEEFYTTPTGPYPNHKLRISVDPAYGYAAINYVDHEDGTMPVASTISTSSLAPPELHLIFSGQTGAVFPSICAISIVDARHALTEWIETRVRPKCVEWQAYDEY
ncbi:hypothetical protein F4559_003514 [Saccharothrix violaceirubra]|uniref:Immunity protein Imm1 n=2 Tax=Saccharothrix violaceirubra TaxID=413306 RepID=A0A7W7WWA1_9PSEU|nr:hypothetical protein [Saccharothrix violaceirubra]